MKYVDTPPILAILFSKLQTPPNWLSFIYTPPKIGENGLHPTKIYKPPSGCFRHIPYLEQIPTVNAKFFQEAFFYIRNISAVTDPIFTNQQYFIARSKQGQGKVREYVENIQRWVGV